MGQRISVYVYANDPILQAGVGSQLRGRPEVAVVDQSELDEADVAVVVTDLVDETRSADIAGDSARQRSAHCSDRGDSRRVDCYRRRRSRGFRPASP